MEKIKTIPFGEKHKIQIFESIKITKIAFCHLKDNVCIQFLKKIISNEEGLKVKLKLLGDTVQERDIKIIDLINGMDNYSEWKIPIFLLEYNFPTIMFFDKEKPLEIEFELTGKSEIKPSLVIWVEEKRKEKDFTVVTSFGDEM